MEKNKLGSNMVELEENARVLYLHFADVCSDRMKDTLLRFSKEEEKHKEIVSTLFRGKENLELNEEVLRMIELQKSYEIEDDSLKRDEDFFVFALSMEKKAIDTFTKCLTFFPMESKEHRFFSGMIEEEKKHMVGIVKILHEMK